MNHKSLKASSDSNLLISRITYCNLVLEHFIKDIERSLWPPNCTIWNECPHHFDFKVLHKLEAVFTLSRTHKKNVHAFIVSSLNAAPLKYSRSLSIPACYDSRLLMECWNVMVRELDLFINYFVINWWQTKTHNVRECFCQSTQCFHELARTLFYLGIFIIKSWNTESTTKIKT